MITINMEKTLWGSSVSVGRKKICVSEIKGTLNAEKNTMKFNVPIGMDGNVILVGNPKTRKVTQIKKSVWLTADQLVESLEKSSKSPKKKADVKPSKSKMYIGIEENNDWEGETFGYYFEDTKENREGLQKVKEKYDPFMDTWDGEFPYKFISEAVSEKELKILDKYDENGYMSRVNFVKKKINWDEIAGNVNDEEDPLYKGTCFDFDGE